MDCRKRSVGLVGMVGVGVLLVALTCTARSDRVRELPDAVDRAVRAAYPNAKVGEFDRKRQIAQVYEVTVVEGDKTYDLTLTEDGELLTRDHEVDVSSLPTAVHDAVQQTAGTVTIEEAEQVETLGQLRAVALTQPIVEYEVTYRLGGKTVELIVSADGTEVRSPTRLGMTNE